MEIAPVKKKILETLWEAEKPIRSREVAEKAGLSIPSATMHLRWLRKMKWVSTPKKDLYTITDSGKEAIGLPKMDKERASAILNPVSSEKAFYFFSGTGQYTGVSADSLTDFCEKIKTVEAKAVEFHMSRGDFERWFHDLETLNSLKRWA